MNQPFRSPDLSLTTQAAEGLPRRRWSVAEIEEATRLGVFDEDERFELIGGEIVPMNSKGIQHEVLKVSLNLYFAANRPPEIIYAQETTFRLNEDSFVEPDFIFFSKSDGIAGLNPRTGLLAVEVADSSLRWDLGRKARIYANFGIPELWVIDAVSRVIHVHSQPRLEGYGVIRQHAETERIESTSVPGIALTLSELETF
jgi:Uma2 family endonuclease